MERGAADTVCSAAMSQRYFLLVVGTEFPPSTQCCAPLDSIQGTQLRGSEEENYCEEGTALRERRVSLFAHGEEDVNPTEEEGRQEEGEEEGCEEEAYEAGAQGNESAEPQAEDKPRRGQRLLPTRNEGSDTSAHGGAEDGVLSCLCPERHRPRGHDGSRHIAEDVH